MGGGDSGYGCYGGGFVLCFFLPWVVAVTVVVVVANGGFFYFLAEGCGCHGGANGGECG